MWLKSYPQIRHTEREDRELQTDWLDYNIKSDEGVSSLVLVSGEV